MSAAWRGSKTLFVNTDYCRAGATAADRASGGQLHAWPRAMPAMRRSAAATATLPALTIVPQIITFNGSTSLPTSITLGGAPITFTVASSAGQPVTVTLAPPVPPPGPYCTLTTVGQHPLHADPRGAGNLHDRRVGGRDHHVDQRHRKSGHRRGEGLTDDHVRSARRKDVWRCAVPVSATASSGLPVTFAASGNCTVPSSTVTITAAGSCTITASQAATPITTRLPMFRSRSLWRWPARRSASRRSAGTDIRAGGRHVHGRGNGRRFGQPGHVQLDNNRRLHDGRHQWRDRDHEVRGHSAR